MRYKIAILFLFTCFISLSQNQEVKNNNLLTFGIGPSMVGKYVKVGGYNMNIGIFLNDNILLLGYSERTFFLSDAIDYGLGLRKYYGKNKYKVYLQPSISYSTYQAWNWNTPPLPVYENKVLKTPKISGLVGFEFPLGKHFNSNLEFGYGYYSNLQFGRMISRVSVNYLIKRKNKK
jgi:hypothetical protein